MYKDIVVNYGSEFENYTAVKLVENDFEAYRIVYRTPWDLTGCTVKAVCRRADGTVISSLGYTEDNCAMFVIDNSMYAVAGELNIRLTVYTASEQVITVCDVNATAVEAFGDGIPGTNTKTVLDQILINVSKLSTELEEHKASEVIDHPDGSVTASKLGEDVRKYILDTGLPEIHLKCSISVSDLNENVLIYDELGNEMEISCENLKNASQSIYRIVFKPSENEGTVNYQDYYGILYQVKGTACVSGIYNFRVIQYLWLSDTKQYLRIAACTVSDSNPTNEYLTHGKWEACVPENKQKRGKARGYAPLDENTLLDMQYIGEKAITGEKIADGTVGSDKLEADLINEIKSKADKAECAILDENRKIPSEYLYGTTIKEYGVRWNGTSSTVCERLGDAAGLVANAHFGTSDSVQNDFDSIYPWSDMRLCNVDADGNILAYDGEPNFARDGSNGDVMVEIPKFYYKRVKTGIAEEWWVCAVKLPGYELHPVFMNDGQEVSKVFHSAYNASSYTDETDSKVKLRSITGVQPTTRITRSSFRTYARNKGSIWSIEDLSCINALQILYLVEYANTNSQAALGSGASSLTYSAESKALAETTEGNKIIISSSAKNTFKVGQRIEIGSKQGVDNKTVTPRTITAVTTDEDAGQTTITFDGNPITVEVGNTIWNVAPLNGSCDELDGKSGWVAGENNYTNGYADVNYRGIEGFHGKLYRFVDGVNIEDGVVHYANSLQDYADDVYAGKYAAIGYENCKTNGCASAFGYDEKAPWVMFPTAAAGDSSTYLADYYYYARGKCLLLFGGYGYNGSYVGVFLFGCSGSFSYTGVGYGAHLIIKKP